MDDLTLDDDPISDHDKAVEKVAKRRRPAKGDLTRVDLKMSLEDRVRRVMDEFRKGRDDAD